MSASSEVLGEMMLRKSALSSGVGDTYAKLTSILRSSESRFSIKSRNSALKSAKKSYLRS